MRASYDDRTRGSRRSPLRPGALAAALAAALLLASGSAGAQTPAKPPEPVNKPLFPVTVEPPLPEPVKTFDEIRHLILDNYYSDSISSADLYWAAIKGMLRHISPPEDPERAKLWPPAEYERVAQALRGVRSSIGIHSTYNRADGSLTVTEVLPGSPAAGHLHPLDRIMRVNGESLRGKSVQQIDAMMRGPTGTPVRLTVVRDIQVLDVHLVISTFASEDLKAEMLPGDVGYILIRRMSLGISRDLAGAVSDLRNAGATRYLVDLRGNGGGVFNEGLKCAELFLPANDPILYLLQHGNRVRKIVSRNTHPVRGHVVVLVDKGTASSAEIFAGALQGDRRARLVGVRTFGKAVVEKTFTLPNRYRVKFIVGALYRPGGVSWQATGLQPDLVVEEDPQHLGRIAALPLVRRLQQDRQLRAGYQLLK